MSAFEKLQISMLSLEEQVELVHDIKASLVKEMESPNLTADQRKELQRWLAKHDEISERVHPHTYKLPSVRLVNPKDAAKFDPIVTWDEEKKMINRNQLELHQVE